MKCSLCPRNCNIDRSVSKGVCRTDGITVSRIAKHMWEEPCISGEKGSGTVFFAGCNLHCRFCQNYDISVNPKGSQISAKRLADVFLYLNDAPLANINLVTPSHFADKIAEALSMCRQKLRIPVVYNTGSYEKAETLKTLEGLVDVYLPDVKFCSPEISSKFANAPDYFDVAVKAVEEMRRQQSADSFDENGYMTRGVIVRHLVLPGHVEDSKRILDWIASFDKTLNVSLMSQYFPAHTDPLYPELNRKLYKHEYESALEYFYNVGLKNGFSQDHDSATKDYLPDFSEEEVAKVLRCVPRVYS